MILPSATRFATFCSSSLFLLSFIAYVSPCCAVPLRLENPWLMAEFDPASGTYEIKNPSGQTVFKNATLCNGGKSASLSQVQDRVFGEGGRIVAGKASITLYRSLPYVLIQSTLDITPSNTARNILPKTITLTTGTVNLNLSPEKLSIIGTGGAMKPKESADAAASNENRDASTVEDKAENTDQSFSDRQLAKPGSYAWAVVGDPVTRAGLVMAWLTHDKAAGLVFASQANGTIQLEARAEYGRYAPKQAVPTETLAIGCFDDVRLGMETWADAVAKVYAIHLPPQMSGYSTNSAGGGHGIAGLENETAEVAKFAARELKPFGLQYLQIDDGWQLTKRDFSTHNPSGPYPGGMKLTADRIRDAGLIPGLWTVPFVGTGKDNSILAKTPDGKPFNARWSGLCLDLTVPKAVDYMVETTRKVTKDWGYGFMKLDGFHAGTATDNIYVNAGFRDTTLGKVIMSDPTKTQIEAFRNGARALREATGPRVFLLGCAATQNMVSYAGSFGLVDAMRVGPDNAGDWGRWASKSPIFGTRHYFENRRIWYVDPDMGYARDSMTLDQARTSCSWTAISGQLFTASDWLPGLSAGRLNLLKRTMEPHHGIARPVDFFEHPAASIWLLSDREPNPTRQTVAIYNIMPYKRTIGDSLKRIGLDPGKEYIGFDFWGNKLTGPYKDRIETSLTPAQCLILSVVPVSDYPRLISTSRHVTQGIVDCVEEKWDPANRTLYCRNRLIGGDPCEMRVVLPDDSANWKPGAVHAMAGGCGPVTREGRLLRFTITSDETREVAWSLSF